MLMAVFGRLPEKTIDFKYRLSCMRKSLQDGRYFYAPLAQMGEHSTFNRVAMGPSSIWSMTAWILNFDNRR